MKDFYEFKADFVSTNFLYSFIYIPYKEYKEYIIFPDGADYIIFSSHHTVNIIKKSLSPQLVNVLDESLLIFRLKPYTLHILQKELKDFEDKLEYLKMMLFKTKSIPHQQQLFSEVLFSGQSFYKKYHIEITSIDLLFEYKSDISVEQLSSMLDCPIRTLQDRSKKYMGLKPKELINIFRFQYITTKSSKFRFNNDLFEYKQYNDYSHLYKELKKYTNLTPKEFFSNEFNCFKALFDVNTL